MKILYAIQGDGNGRLTRAKELIPFLELRGALDVLVSGEAGDFDLNFPIKYRFKGLSFVRNKVGQISYWRSITQARMPQFLKEIKNFPIEEYDLIINDFEPITAWAAQFRRKPYISLGNQAAFASRKTPKALLKNILGELVLKYYAPIENPIGIHYKDFDDFVYPSIIGQAVQALKPSNQGHYSVYLPTLEDKEIVEALKQLRAVQWQVYSPQAKKVKVDENVSLRPYEYHSFLNSLASSKGCLTAAAYQLPAEVLYLGKKLMIMPAAKNYEQTVNADFLRSLGLPVINRFGGLSENRILSWVERTQHISLPFTLDLNALIQHIFKKNDLLKRVETENEFSMPLAARLLKPLFF